MPDQADTMSTQCRNSHDTFVTLHENSKKFKDNAQPAQTEAVCFHCSEKGHMVNRCPKKLKDEKVKGPKKKMKTNKMQQKSE